MVAVAKAPLSSDNIYSHQSRLRCAAEHMTFSSIIGGFAWDIGKYDAFETIMEVGAPQTSALILFLAYDKPTNALII